MQEVALARYVGVHCGEYEIDWEVLVTAARVLYRSVRRSTLRNLRLPFGFPFCKVIDQTRRD